MIKITTFLKRIGLDDKEADVYEYLLNTGEQSVSELSTGTNLKRGDLYNILYSLRDNGLVTQVERKGKSTFTISDPYNLRGQIGIQKARLEEADAVAETVLPKIVSQYNLTFNKPSVRYFEGLDGVREVHSELIASGTKELLLLRSLYDGANPEIAALTTEMVARQLKAGIKRRIIGPLEDESRRRFEQTDSLRGIERRIVETDQMLLPSQIMIWNDSVAIISLRGIIVATVIENKDTAETFRNMFSYMWDKALPYHDKITADWKSPNT